MKLSLVTRISDPDEPYILSWLLHYSKLGFDDILLYDMSSSGNSFCLKNMELWRRLCSPMTVTYIPNFFPCGILDTDQNIINAFPTIRNLLYSNPPHENLDWVFHIDTDEYIWSPTPFRQFLERIPPHVGQVQFYWMMIENFGVAYSNAYETIKNSPWFVNPHVKSGARVHSSLEMNTDVHHWKVPPHFSTWVHSTMLPSGHERPIYHEISNYKKYHQIPFIFHLHSRSRRNSFCKIILHKLPGKSDDTQRKLLHEALKQKNSHLLMGLTKLKLIIGGQQQSQFLPNEVGYNNIIASLKTFMTLPEDKFDVEKETEIFETCFPDSTHRSFLDNFDLINL
jgi:hypothetical protein